MSKLEKSKGIKALEDYDYNTAIGYFNKSLSYNDRDTEVLTYLGTAYALKSFHEDYYKDTYENQALANYQKSLNIDSNKAFTYSSIGRYYEIIKKELNKAIYYYEKALTKDSKYPILNKLGNLYFKLNDFKKSIYYYKKDIVLEKTTNTLFELGRTYFQISNYDSALVFFNEVKKSDPNYENIYYHLAMTYLNLNQKSNSVSNFQIAARLGNEAAKEWLKTNNYSW